MKNNLCLLLIVLILLLSCTGCGKETMPSLVVPETKPQTATVPVETSRPQDENLEFDYAPGSMGSYVRADSDIEADSEVLNSITMTLSDKDKELTRHRVSDRQFDFIKDGHQVGGFLLVDIPRDMLEKAPESWTEFETAVDHIAKQVMGDIYPSVSYISGGGHVDFGFDLPVYMIFSIRTDNKDQYMHHIYIGETYIYDFWHDTCYLADGGETIMSTLSAEDIKPELNQRDPWSVHDFQDSPWAPKS